MRVLSKLACFACMLCFLQSAVAFEQMQSYAVADGLVGPIVPLVYQDSRGILWFGSDSGGISRYDGTHFTPYTQIVHGAKTEPFRGRTRTIVEDKWGHIWCLSQHPAEGSGIISRYNGTDFEKMTVGTCLTVDNNGDVWVGSDNAFTRYKSLDIQEPPQAFRHALSGTSVAIISVIFQSKTGTYWVGGHDAKGVFLMKFRADPDMWQIADMARVEDILDAPKDRAVQRIMQDRDGVLWFGGHALLFNYDGVQFRDVLQTAGTQISDTNAPVSIKSDRHGRIWFSDNSDVHWWDGNTLRRFKYDQGSFQIEDAWDTLWFASETGVHAYKSQYFEKALNSPFQLEETEHPKVYTVDAGLGSDNIITIFEALDGKIWFGHDNGVTSYEQHPVIVNWTTRTVLGSNSVRVMMSDSAGTLWLSIPGGIARFLGDQDSLIQHNLTNLPYTLETHPDNATTLNRRTEISVVFEADGYIWFVDKPILSQDPWTLYRIFRYVVKDEKFEKYVLRIQAKSGTDGETIHVGSDPFVTAGSTPWLIIGGWVFLPQRDGMQRLLPDGTFRKHLFTATATLPAPVTPVVTVHTDTRDRLWCYYDTGEIKRFSNIIAGPVQREVLQHRAILPVIRPTATHDVHWFYNTVSKHLMFWQDLDDPNTLTALPDSVSGRPLFAIQNGAESIFVFHESLKTYQGTTLKNAAPITVESVNSALLSSQGDLWLATAQGAIQYDGETARSWTTADGFLVDDLRDVHEDPWGNVWFATWGGGVVRYDGNTFQSITTKDGLIHNNVSHIHAVDTKTLWFGTEGGATQYRAHLGALPFCRIVSVDAGTSFTEPFRIASSMLPVTEIPELLPARLKAITVHFQGVNPLRDAMTYHIKLIGLGTPAWTRIAAGMTSTETPIANAVQSIALPQQGDTGSFPYVQYTGLTSGKYTLLIKAFREGSPYTQQPAVLAFTIDRPVWSRWRNYLPTLIFIAAVGSLLFRLIVNRRQTAQLRLQMAEKEEADMQRIRAELREAQNIQMGLLPTEPPQTHDFDIAGRSVPATQVGGDFFDYLTVQNGQTAIAVADAAGKGIRGAMNAVLTNGMLHEVARYKSEAAVILTDLNTGLAPRMYGPSFIALNLAVLNASDTCIEYANGGQPYPVLKRGDQIVEIETSDLPLGSRKNVDYESATFDLNPGEFLIFHSDGLIEALNAQQDMYGPERLNTLIAQISDDSSAEDMIERIFEDIQGLRSRCGAV